jgi:hypothetical protein
MTTRTRLIVGGIIPLLLLLVIVYFSGKHTQKVLNAQITMLANENQTFTNIITKDRQHITTQDQRIVTLEMAKAALLVNIDSLKTQGIKNVQVIVKLNTEIRRLELLASYTQPPVIIHDPSAPLQGDYLKLPAPWGYSDDWFNIIGTIGVAGVSLQRAATYSEPSITLGYSKKLFNSKPIVVFSDKNPYTIVKDMSNIVIINKPPFYKRPGFYVLEGVAVTILGAWTVNQIK